MAEPDTCAGTSYCQAHLLRMSFPTDKIHEEDVGNFQDFPIIEEIVEQVHFDTDAEDILEEIHFNADEEEICRTSAFRHRQG